MTPLAIAAPHQVNLCLGPINVACSAVTGAVGDATQVAEKGVLDVVASAVQDAAQTVVTGMLSALDTTTQVDFGATWFSSQTKVMAGIALPFVMAFFLIQVIGSVLRREPGGLARAGFGLAKALVAGAAALPILQLLLAASDEMCSVAVGGSGDGVAALATRLFAVVVVIPSAGAVLTAIIGCWTIAAAFVLWGVLLFRKALLLVTGAFTLLAFAGASWDATRGWVRKWAETAAALVFSKLVIVVVLVTGINAMGLTGGSESGGATLSDVFAGLLLLSIATLAPWLCWKFVHWSGSEIAHDLHTTMSRSPVPQAIRSGGHLAKGAATHAAGAPGSVIAGSKAASAGPRPPSPPSPRTNADSTRAPSVRANG